MLIIAIVVIAIAAFFFFSKKSKPIVNTHTPQLTPLLTLQIDFYNNLNDADKQIFKQRIQTFLNDVNIEGVGLIVDDTDRIMVAASAVIPIFGFKDWTYRNITNVLLYPDTFDKEFQYDGNEGEGRNIMGMVGSGYMNGQMILSRNALIKGFSKNPGKGNTGIHEFVHLLDKTDGATDGVPETFLPHEYTKPWLSMMHQEIHKITAGRSDIDPYAATNEAEFFAVISEYFFEKPDEFQTKHPELYQMLSKIFVQDPAEK